ncbi:MAG TPA: hypothetical protein VNA20_18845 [Frankiaceae bacterium]|nr:hypothetical protein [Frankiaceae bacterium]
MSPELRRRPPTFARLGGGLALILIALGLLAVALGWNGAAGTALTAAQFPYLLSGGILGLSLIVLGSSLMIVKAHREDRARIERKLDEVIDAIGGAGFGGGGAQAPTDLTGLVVAGSASYHTPDCRLVDGREDTQYLTPEEARARFLAPCRVCQPEPSNVTTY